MPPTRRTVRPIRTVEGSRPRLIVTVIGAPGATPVAKSAGLVSRTHSSGVGGSGPGCGPGTAGPGVTETVYAPGPAVANQLRTSSQYRPTVGAFTVSTSVWPARARSEERRVGEEGRDG